MIQFVLNLFKKKKAADQEMLYPFVVECKLMLDENTTLVDSFYCTIYAKSKKDAKFRVATRAFVKAGAVANKAQLEKHLNTKA